MAPFRRSAMSTLPEGSATTATSDIGRLNLDDNGDAAAENGRSDIWERRRRRILNIKKTAVAEQAVLPKTGSADSKKGEKKISLDDDEQYDPYDSDPGESYRQHCMRINGLSTKSCLTLPRLLGRGNRTIGDESVITAPSSPFHSE